MIDEEMKAYLISIPGVAAELVADGKERIYPAPLPQDATLPAETYTDISDVPSYTNANDSCYRQMRMQLDAWASTRRESVRVDQAVRDAMSGYSGKWGGRDIGFVRRADSSSHYESETKLWRVRSDYLIHVLS